MKGENNLESVLDPPSSLVLSLLSDATPVMTHQHSTTRTLILPRKILSEARRTLYLILCQSVLYSSSRPVVFHTWCRREGERS